MDIAFQSLIIIYIFFTIFWFVLHVFDRSRIVLNSFVFLFSIGLLILILIYFAYTYTLNFLYVIAIILFIIIFISIPILFISIFFGTGITLIKKEGFSKAHFLSILFGLGTIFSIFVSPIILLIIEFSKIGFVIVLFTSYFYYFIFGFIVFYISSILYTFAYERKNKNYIIILGAGINKDKVTPLLAARVDKGIDFYNKQKSKKKLIPKLIMSGGQGKNEEISEALAMKNYAIEKGIPEEDIICEDKSTTTNENLLFSKKIIEEREKNIKKCKILFVTTNYHVFRAALISKTIKLKASGIGSKVKLYYYVSAVIREYIAILVFHKKTNIILSSLISFAIAMIYYIIFTPQV